MAGTTHTGLTIEAFEALDIDLRKRSELIRGVLVDEGERLAAKARLSVELGFLLFECSQNSELEAGTRLECDLTAWQGAPTIRRAELALHPREDWLERTSGSTQRFRGGPALVIEIASPGQSFDGLQEKLLDFFNAGTIEAWIVSPQRKIVQVLTQGGVDIHEYRIGTTLESSVLTGLKLDLSQLFDG